MSNDSDYHNRKHSPKEIRLSGYRKLLAKTHDDLERFRLNLQIKALSTEGRPSHERHR